MGSSTDEQAGTAVRPVDELSYAEASAELDDIVGFFEGRDVDVDQLVGRLVRATEIIEELDKRLRRTQMQVEQLVPRLAAVLEERPDGARSEERADEEPTHLDSDGGADSFVRTVDVEVAAAHSTSVPVDSDDDSSPGLF